MTALETRLTTGDAPAIRSVLAELATTSSLAVPRALIDAGFTEAGDEALREELKQSKATSPTAAAKELLTTLANRRVEVAEALENAGQHDAAVEEIKAAVRADPKVVVPSDLRPEDRRLPWWRTLLGDLGPWVRSIAEFALVLLATVALVLSLWKLLRRFVKRRLELGEISGEGGPDIGQGLREQFGRLKDHHGGASLEQVSASGAAYTVPADVSKAIPAAGVIVAAFDALNRLFPARRWRVAGVAGSSGPNGGPAVTMTIARRDGRVRFAETLRLKDYRWQVPQGEPASTDWHRLALPAAVWLTFQAGRRAPTRYRRFEALGTDNWRSYALFAAGAEVPAVVTNDAQRHFARRLYLDALEADPRNHGAALNLASLELLEATLSGEEGTTTRLRGQARWRLAGLTTRLQQQNSFRENPLWYRARYMEMSAQLPPAGPSPAAAYSAGLDLVAGMLAWLDWFSMYGSWRRRPRALHAFLRTNEGPAIAGFANASFAAGGAAPTATTPVPTRRGLLVALNATPTGTHVDPAQLAAYVERHCLETARGRYNLACYHLRAGNNDEATKQLRSAVALGGPELAAQALIDPDLADLADDVNSIVEEEQGPALEPGGEE